MVRCGVQCLTFTVSSSLCHSSGSGDRLLLPELRGACAPALTRSLGWYWAGLAGGAESGACPSISEPGGHEHFLVSEHSACVMTESATKRRKQRGPRPAAPQVVSRGTGCSSLDQDPVPAPCSSCEALDGFLTSLSLVPFLQNEGQNNNLIGSFRKVENRVHDISAACTVAVLCCGCQWPSTVTRQVSIL